MTDDKKSNFVFAAVSYSNAAPLAHFLPRAGAGVRVTYDRPSELVGGLIRGEADVALIPVVDYFATPGLKRIDGPGICADGDVRSVLLKCSRQIDRVRVVGRDPASRTSNALARIVLEDHFGLSVRMPPAGPAQAVDAEVMIGDRALCSAPAEAGDYDLAGLWKAMTDLPFVFAVWAHRAEHPQPEALAEIARAARDAGVGALAELAAIHAERLSLPTEYCLDYLSHCIHYDVGPREIEAMGRFKRRIEAGPDSMDAASAASPVEAPGDVVG